MSDLRDLATLCNEIDYLMTQVETLRKERDNMGDWIDLTKLCKELDDRTAQVETLHKERDEARREVCKAESSGRIGRFGTAQEHAERMGWDCYKEAK